MRAVKVLATLLGFFLVIPIGLVLQYKIMTLIPATDVMWLLFWVNLPLTVGLQIIFRVAELVESK